MFEVEKRGVELVFCSTAAERELYERIKSQHSSDLKTVLRNAVEGFDSDIACILASPRCAAVAVRVHGKENRLNAVLESDHTVLSSAHLPGASYVNKRIGTVLPNGTYDFVSKLA